MSTFAVLNLTAAFAHSFLALQRRARLLAFAAGIYTPNATLWQARWCQPNNAESP